ncbi:MAG TPA: sensor histidine kinase [Symbiobacteriaceae bacterium]|nr:sensor histidine kinase [Symbiobacteriaceae bacterium]
MKSQRFPYWAVLLPSILVGSFEFARHTFFERVLPRTWGNIGAAVLVGAASAIYIGLAFRYIRQMERHASRAREEATLLQERDRLARDLHDNISQTVFYMAVRLDELAQTGDPTLQEAVADLKDDLQAADAKIRRTIADLRRRRAPRTLGAALRSTVDEVARTFRLKVDLVEPSQEIRLGEATLEHVGGILHEALTNAAKYAAGAKVSVTATVRRDALHLVVQDSGRGFDPDGTPAGFGLQMMAERAAMMGGSLHVVASPGAGTRVELTVPLNGQQQEGER